MSTTDFPTDPKIDALARVKRAADEAGTICQRCGNGSASAGGSGWITTLCETCRSKPDVQDAP